MSVELRKALRWGLPALLLAGAAVTWLSNPPRIEGSLYGLAGKAAERIPRFAREAGSREVYALVSSADGALAESTAESLRREWGTPPQMPPGLMDFLLAERGGLASAENRQLLATAEGRRKIARRALRRLYASPVPPVLGEANDPFGLADSFLTDFAAVGGAAVPTVETNGVTCCKVRKTLAEPLRSLDDNIRAVRELSRQIDRFRRPGVSIRLGGVPVHTALSAARTQKEIGWLTVFSLVFIAVLSAAVFKSVRWLPMLALSLGVAALAGVWALGAVFREVHILTLAFGTTLLSLVIDYSFHWLLSGETSRRGVVRNLAVSFVTTAVSLLPLAFASIPVLRQTAVFLGAGLLAALLYVVLAYPNALGAADASPSRPGPLRAWRLVLIPIAVAAVAGIGRMRFETPVAALYAPPAELAEVERINASFATFDFKRWPSLDERRRTYAHELELYRERGPELAAAMGLEKLTPPPAPSVELDEPRALIGRVLARWTAETRACLAAALLVMFAVLLGWYRLAALRIALPSALAIAFAGSVLAWTGTPFTLFHLLAAFLLAGMSVDYTIFLHSGERGVLKSAFAAMLTSMAGFGALATVSFPVVRAFGLTLGVGLPVAFVAALATVPRRENAVERAASPLGLAILWWLYRGFGLRALHFGAAAVGTCVWLCSPEVRRRTRSRRQVVDFTESLADKLAVMGDGRSLPEVVVEETADAAEFLRLVRTGAGVFVISSHVGAVEVLPALGGCDRVFHAWMDVSRTGVFTRFYLRHAHRAKVRIHDVAGMGMETAFMAGDALDRGDCLLMAGDRGAGVFRFAAALGHPVFFVACVKSGSCRYRAIVRRLPGKAAAMAERYRSEVAALVAEFPEQDYNWRR